MNKRWRDNSVRKAVRLAKPQKEAFQIKKIVRSGRGKIGIRRIVSVSEDCNGAVFQ